MKTPRPAQRPLRPRDNSYRAEDILAEFGTLAQFMAVAGPKAPLAIPDLGFTAAENKRWTN